MAENEPDFLIFFNRSSLTNSHSKFYQRHKNQTVMYALEVCFIHPAVLARRFQMIFYDAVHLLSKENGAEMGFVQFSGS